MQKNDIYLKLSYSLKANVELVSTKIVHNIVNHKCVKQRFDNSSIRLRKRQIKKSHKMLLNVKMLEC